MVTHIELSSLTGPDVSPRVFVYSAPNRSYIRSEMTREDICKDAVVNLDKVPIWVDDIKQLSAAMLKCIGNLAYYTISYYHIHVYVILSSKLYKENKLFQLCVMFLLTREFHGFHKPG